MYEAQLNRIAQTPLGRVGRDTTAVPVEYGGKYPYLVVLADAYQLALEAGLDVDLYSLARCVSSEYGRSGPNLMLAAAESVRNGARKSFGPGAGAIWKKLTWEKPGTKRHELFAGKYGEQRGRFASTRQDPEGRHVAAARVALVDGTELVRGATSWFEPVIQDQGVQAGKPLTYDAVGIVQKWYAAGNAWTGELEGLNSYSYMGFIDADRGGVPIAHALEAIERGRTGLPTSTKGGQQRPTWPLLRYPGAS